MDDGLKTPRRHPDFNSYVKFLRVFITNGRTNRQTDRLGNLIGFSRLIVVFLQPTLIEKSPFNLINTIFLLHIPLLALTDGQTE
jgi:hypothetical protein